MKNDKTPTIEQIAGVEKILQTSKQVHTAPIPSKSQAFVCGFCVYFRDVKKSFCHFTGEKIAFMDTACEYSEAVQDD